MRRFLQTKRICLMAGVTLLLATGTLFAAEEPATVDGDNIEYDMNTGVVKASGDVVMVKGELKITGDRAEYNSSTQEGIVTGNVFAVRNNMEMKADRITSDEKQHMVATGNVWGRSEDKTFSGTRVDYFQPQDYILIEERGTITSKDGSFSADVLEGYFAREEIFGKGNVYIVSEANNMEAGGDRIDYSSKDRGRAVLTGNAWAVQGNNKLKGERLVIHLAENRTATVSE